MHGSDAPQTFQVGCGRRATLDPVGVLLLCPSPMLERASKRARHRHQSDGAPPSPPDAAVRVQAAFRGFAARCEGLTTRRRSSSEAAAARRRELEAANLKARARSAEYRQISRLCRQADPFKLAAVDASLERLIGHELLKEYCASLRSDCLARAALGEPPLVRNVLISGSLGVGKKLAAETLAALLRALGAAKGMVTTQTTLDQITLDVRRDVSCVIVEGLDRIEASRGKIDAILANYPDHCFIFLGPTQAVEALHGAVPHFRKVEPAWLQLPNYTPAELAAITAAQLRDRGYGLAADLGLPELQAALSATWPRDVLAMRNAHLASELVQRAISHRNQRVALPRLLTLPPTLSAADLGLQSHGLMSLLAQRAAVDAEVGELVGMAPLKRFLEELRAKVEFVGRGGDPRLLEGCLNVVLTGNPGAGATPTRGSAFTSRLCLCLPAPGGSSEQLTLTLTLTPHPHPSPLTPQLPSFTLTLTSYPHPDSHPHPHPHLTSEPHPSASLVTHLPSPISH